MTILRWLLKNSGSLLLAFVLALLVWAAAVNEADALITQEFPGAVAIEYVNVEPGYVLVGLTPQQGAMTVRAPASVWEQLGESDLSLTVDLSGLQEGSHTLETVSKVDVGMVRVISFEPRSLELTLEPSLSQQMGVNVELSGEPATGYFAEEEDTAAQPDRATVEGPSSQVILVEELRALVDIAGRSGDMSVNVEIEALDIAGDVVEGVSVSPSTTTVRVSFSQQSGFRYVAVVPIIQGSPASGYWVRNITYSPTAVTLQSADPQAVDLLPGYVETEPLVLTGARETIEQTVLLSLPEGFTVIGDPGITLVVTIEALDTSITITRSPEIEGLNPGYTAQASPGSVRVFLHGPQPTLEDLQPEDVIVVLDLEGFAPGTYQLVPQVRVFLSEVEVQAILPETIEVTITEPAP